MPCIINKKHLSEIGDHLDFYLKNKPADCTLYSEDGAEFKVHKELFGQTEFMRKILSSAKDHCCGLIEVICPCNENELAELTHFLYHGEIQCEDVFESVIINENLNKIFGYSEILNLNDQITSLLAEPSLASAVDIAELELNENAIENLRDENNNLEDVDLNNNHVTEPKSKLNTNENVQDCNELDSIYEPRENIPKHSSFDYDPKRISRTECCHEEQEIYKNNNQLKSTFLIDDKVSNYVSMNID